MNVRASDSLLRLLTSQERIENLLTGPQIGDLFGIGCGPVSRERKRLREQMLKDKKLRAIMKRLEGELSTKG